MKTIGRYYEVSLNSAMNNTYEFYVPLANDIMSCDDLILNASKLQALVSEWEVKATDPGNNSTETNNATSIVNILQGRLDDYNRYIAAKCNVEQPIDPADHYATDPVSTTETGGNKNTMLLILAAAGIGAYFLLRKKKGKVTGSKKGSFMLPLLIGGGIVYYFANKKYGQATQQNAITTTVAPGEMIPSTTDGLVVVKSTDLPLGSGGQVISDEGTVYNETINYN